MRILIVEDDAFKASKIVKAVEEHSAVHSLRLAKSVNSGLEEIASELPELLLLDMSLTTFDLGPEEGGGRPRNFGGVEIFDELTRQELACPVVVITQLESFIKDGRTMRVTELKQFLKKEYPDTFLTLIYYDVEGRWKSRLTSMLDKVERRV